MTDRTYIETTLIRESKAALDRLVTEAVAAAFGVPDDGKWYEVRGYIRRTPFGIAETSVLAIVNREDTDATH